MRLPSQGILRERIERDGFDRDPGLKRYRDTGEPYPGA
jgi:hypothetical protein